MTFLEYRLTTYRPGAFLKVTGTDAFDFLQGQFSNELRRPPGGVTYGLWLNQRGKIVADSHVLQVAENEFRLTSVHSTAASIRQRLEEYIVADDVAVTDQTETVQGLTIWGSGSSTGIKSLLGEVPAPETYLQREGLMFHRGCRLPGDSFEILGPMDAVKNAGAKLLALGAVLSDEAALEFARICAGIPAVPVDLGSGDLPNEGGLDVTALSYTKGCYLGQEVMARLKNLGQVRRRLHVVRGRVPAPAPGAALYQGEKKLGEVRSVAVRSDEFVALAMLSLVNLNPEASLSLKPSGPAVINLSRHE
jgi:folate-binding protein YgfZ